MNKKVGQIIIIIFSLLPIVRWVMMPGWQYRFMDLNSSMTSIGQITGLVGMVLFSLNLILSNRTKLLDKFFQGLDKSYDFHHKIGAVAFSLLLFHPLFLAVKYIQLSLREAALFLLPGQNMAITWGIIALALMILLMVLTFFVRLKYPHWKISHKFMVLVFIFAILHSLLITSDISRDIILRVYVLGFAALGLAAGFYRAWLSKFLNHRYKYTVTKIIPESGNTVSIMMAPVGRAMEFFAGQFIFISFKSKNIGPEIHPFTISSAPDEKELRLTIKSLGDYTADLNKLQTGDTALIEGPYGAFSYQNFPNQNQIWIAGGVGITPFLSMSKKLSDPDYHIDLYYSFNNSQEAVLLDDLINIAKLNSSLNIFPWNSQEKGYLTAQAISDSSNGLRDKDFLLCGPPIFMESLKIQLIALGVSKERIHWEKFSFL